MGMFSKKTENSNNMNRENNKIIYTIKYNSFFETYRYPNPMDFFFGILGLMMVISEGIEPALGIFFTLAIIDGYFWFATGGNKVILTDKIFKSNMWTKTGIPYKDIISCEIRDADTLIIKSKLIGNFYLHNLHMFEMERIKNIIDEKIKNNNINDLNYGENNNKNNI
jgi:hypothetical protein